MTVNILHNVYVKSYKGFGFLAIIRQGEEIGTETLNEKDGNDTAQGIFCCGEVGSDMRAEMFIRYNNKTTQRRKPCHLSASTLNDRSPKHISEKFMILLLKVPLSMQIFLL